MKSEMAEDTQLSFLPPEVLEIRVSEHLEMMDFYMEPHMGVSCPTVSPYFRPQFTFTETKDSNWASSRSRAPGVIINFAFKDGDFS